MTPKPLEQQVAELAAEVARQGKILASIAAVFTGGVNADGSITPATDADLDSQYGDEKIRCNPRDWKGASRKGDVMSKCEPDFLDLYVGAMLYFAEKNADPKKAGYDRRAAARAAGWAKRLRSGWQPKTGPAPARDAWGRPFGTAANPKPVEDGRAFDGFGAPPASDIEEDEIPF